MKTSGRSDILIWQSIVKAVQLISKPGTQVAIVFHVNPDGDAIGSALALCRFLEKLGHPCHVISPNGIPAVLNWMPGAERIIRASENLKVATRLLKEAGLIFALDFNEVGRVKELSRSFMGSSAYKVLIDHHPGPEDFTDCILSDTSASSTAELVYRFINQTGYSDLVDEDIATCLFAGIMTDTGCFSYNSSGQSTWETVAALLNYGINKDAIYHRIYDNYSVDRMRLLGHSLNDKMVVLPQLHTAFIALSLQDLHNYNFQIGDSEGFVNYPLSIKGIRFSVLFIEREDHIRISLRSKGSFSVNEISRKYFNGGGHMNAAGGESASSLADTITLFKKVLSEYSTKLMDDKEEL